jgi:hypothetical protein
VQPRRDDGRVRLALTIAAALIIGTFVIGAAQWLLIWWRERHRSGE